MGWQVMKQSREDEIVQQANTFSAFPLFLQNYLHLQMLCIFPSLLDKIWTHDGGKTGYFGDIADTADCETMNITYSFR